MDYLGDKLTVAQTHMTQWMGTVRRSFQDALNLVTTAVGHERASGETSSRTPFKRTSSFRHLASRSRESFRRFSARSQQRFSSLRKRQPDSEPPEFVSLLCLFKILKEQSKLLPSCAPRWGRVSHSQTREVASSSWEHLSIKPPPVPAPHAWERGVWWSAPDSGVILCPEVVGKFILDSTSVWTGLARESG